MIKKLFARFLALSDWYEASDLYRWPEPHFYFGLHMGNTVMYDKLKKAGHEKLAKFFGGDPVCQFNPYMTKYLFGKQQEMVRSESGQFERRWKPEFEKKLKKFKLDKTIPFWITLPLWMDFCAMRSRVYCKSKFEHYSFEEPPYVKLVLFGIDLCLYWTAPGTNRKYKSDDSAYWETMFEYLDAKVKNEHGINDMTMLEKAEYMANKCGFWWDPDNESQEPTFCMAGSFVKDKKVASRLDLFNKNMLEKAKARHEKLRCPYCGGTLWLDDEKALTTMPPKYEYHCDRCKAISYLNERIK